MYINGKGIVSLLIYICNIYAWHGKRVGEERNPPENAMLEQEMTHVCTTVFSCRVNGLGKTPHRSRQLVHVFIRKKASSPADMFSDGTIPDVRFSFITMKLRNSPSAELTTTERTVICSDHAGRASPSNAFSVDSASRAAAVSINYFSTDQLASSSSDFDPPGATPEEERCGMNGDRAERERESGGERTGALHRSEGHAHIS
jgi:hypothetical protein